VVVQKKTGHPAANGTKVFLENDPTTVLNESPRQPGVLEKAKVPASSISVRYQSIGLVEHVESFQADLHLHAFSDRDVFEDGHIRAEISGACKVIPARVSVAERIAGQICVAN
jgi:hypothetical protein